MQLRPPILRFINLFHHKNVDIIIANNWTMHVEAIDTIETAMDVDFKKQDVTYCSCEMRCLFSEVVFPIIVLGQRRPSYRS